MLVLHAHWQPPATIELNGAVLFWSETSDAAIEQPARRARSPRPPTAQSLTPSTSAAASHPFCAPRSESEAALRTLGWGGGGRTVSATLLLPTSAGVPRPSPQLVHDWTLDLRKPPALAAWQVQGLLLPPAAAVAVLLALPPDVDLPPSLHIADDARYWASATNLVLEAIAQQKLLPTLEPLEEAAGTRYFARWRPVLDGPRDGPRLAQLAAQMPPVCRAEASTPAEAPMPRPLLHSFLDNSADALARIWIRQTAAPAFVAPNQTAGDWLRTLFADSAQAPGSQAQLGRLHISHRAWLRSLHMAGDSHVRVAFRLESPQQQPKQRSKASDGWMLHFLLQARDDPSLLVPAELAWQTGGSLLHALGRTFSNPQEMLLAGLGYAARICEPLRRSLQTGKPTTALLTTEEAFAFMRSAGPILEESGFGVLVPPWWNKPGTRLGVRLRMQAAKGATPDAVAKGALSLDKLVDYRWEVSLGEASLTRDEFDALVAIKSPLVRFRGQWVQLDPDQVEAAVRFWQRLEEGGALSLADAVQLGLNGAPIEGLDVQEVTYDGWLGEWMDRLTGREQLTVLPQPTTLCGQLRPYQQYGYSWLDFLRRWRLGACLADDMGLGKTIQTLALLLRIREDEGQLPGPVLLVAPTSVVTNWARESATFAPSLRVIVHQGAQRLREEALLEQARATDLVLSSYAVVRRDAATLNQVDWFGVVLDEAQNIKNAETRQAQVMRKLPATFRLALTGTPVENRLSELWSIMHFLNPGYLGSRQSFRRQFALPIERSGDAEAAERLRSLVAPFILRRVKTDPTVIRDLPEKQESKVYCFLSPEQATLYEAVVREQMQQIEGAGSDIQRRGEVLTMLLKLKQICNHPAQFLHQVDANVIVSDEDRRSGKLLRLVEMLEEVISVGDRALIFTQFAEMGKLLKSYLQARLGVATQFLHGGTPTTQRAEMVRRFQEDADGPPLFLLSLKAGGTGLNLTRANHVFHFDRWWNPAVENQATDRAFRIGQQRNVQVHKFVCTGTLEEKIDEMIENKQALAASVLGSGEQWLTDLSTDQLRVMVMLRRDALEQELA